MQRLNEKKCTQITAAFMQLHDFIAKSVEFSKSNLSLRTRDALIMGTTCLQHTGGEGIFIVRRRQDARPKKFFVELESL